MIFDPNAIIGSQHYTIRLLGRGGGERNLHKSTQTQVSNVAHWTLFFMKRRGSLHSPWLFFTAMPDWTRRGSRQDSFPNTQVSPCTCTENVLVNFSFLNTDMLNTMDVSKEVAGFGHLKYDYFKTEHFLICTYIYSSSFYLLINKKGPTLINFIFSIAKSVRT